MSDPLDQAIAMAAAAQRNPIQEAIAGALPPRPDAPNVGSGSLIRWTDADNEEHEGAFALFIPKDISWEAALAIYRSLGDVVTTAAQHAAAARPASGLVLARGNLPKLPD